ncbi:MAG: glycosyltransferase [Planctomycetota bacterium]
MLWDFYEEAFAGVPMRLVGHNPGMPGVAAADSWDHLKRILRSCRFFVHTADPRMEAGYNMASVEAMATGLPVLGNLHPTSPVKHGVSGFLSNDPSVLRGYARMLLEDKRLATLMGRKARKTALECFPMSKFKESFLRSIETARRKWQEKPA